MPSRYLPPCINSIQFMFGRCRLKNFKMTNILDTQTERIEQFWISMSPRNLPSHFSLIWPSIWEMCLEEFPDGRHLGYQNGTNLVNLNLYFAPIPPVKYQAQSDLPFGRCRLKNFEMAAILDIEMERIYKFWMSISLRYLLSSFSLIWLFVREMSFKDGRHLGCRNGTSLAILNFLIVPIPPSKFQLNLTFRSGGDVI